MKREIKFRIWHDGIQEMLYQFTLPMAGVGQDLNQAFAWLLKPIMQFTGLHDKNGKEIYEGDIVKTGTDKAMIVGWSERHASFVIERDGWMFRHYFGEAFESNECEVIGNIYETPALLDQ